MSHNLFHQGELAVQKKANEEEIVVRTASVVKQFLPVGAMRFIEKQSIILASSVDARADMWVSMLLGQPGFVTAYAETELNIHLPAIFSSRQDPFWENIQSAQRLGLLFIDLSTRRRLRVNGTVSSDPENLRLSVEQAYANCPKYIQRRELEFTTVSAPFADTLHSGAYLAAALKDWIQNSDTFFVGSSDGEGNLDASHRGGNPGFVEVVDDRTLRIPDYPGNSMFNTLGNFVDNPAAGLLFVDFKTGNCLHLTGKAIIEWEKSENGTDRGAATGTGT